LRELGAVRLHEADEPLDAEGLVRAAQGAHREMTTPSACACHVPRLLSSI
jgi:hypothetical protein